MCSVKFEDSINFNVDRGRKRPCIYFGIHLAIILNFFDSSYRADLEPHLEKKAQIM